eukprot:GHVU01195617.1.p1 GENE.GHVU01195617.1~~GHVU01195617.1.p1  ORF type:complete len:175 (-),score=27.42 GHVU01195617.1:713-1237(-)
MGSQDFLNYVDSGTHTQFQDAEREGETELGKEGGYKQLERHELFTYLLEAPPAKVMEDAGVMRLRRFCTVRRIPGWKGKTKGELVAHIGVEIEKRKHLACVVEAVGASAALAPTGVPLRMANSLAEKRLLKWNKEFRLLNVLYSASMYPKWLGSGSRLTRLDIDGKRIGNRAEV